MIYALRAFKESNVLQNLTFSRLRETNTTLHCRNTFGVRLTSCFLLYTKAAIASSVSFHPFGQPSPVGVVY
jgi:hypothetical protein